MRTVSFAVMVLIAPLVYANDVSFFVTPKSVTHTSSTGTQVSAGVGASLNLFWNRKWSTLFSVATEQSYVEASTSTPVAAFYEERLRTYPVDAIAQYHFVNMSNWQPYAGLGLRYVKDRTSAEVNGGVVWHFSQHWGLTFDARQLLRGDSPYDSATKGSFGFSWSY